MELSALTADRGVCIRVHPHTHVVPCPGGAAAGGKEGRERAIECGQHAALSKPTRAPCPAVTTHTPPDPVAGGGTSLASVQLDHLPKHLAFHFPPHTVLPLIYATSCLQGPRPS